MTRQVIHPIPGVTLDDIRIDTLLERPSPHVSPIASLMTRQVSNKIIFDLNVLAPAMRPATDTAAGGATVEGHKHQDGTRPAMGSHNPQA
ncbi:hypothetical protein ACLOJK_022613, partial [Asimina triloba]